MNEKAPKPHLLHNINLIKELFFFQITVLRPKRLPTEGVIRIQKLFLKLDTFHKVPSSRPGIPPVGT